MRSNDSKEYSSDYASTLVRSMSSAMMSNENIKNFFQVIGQSDEFTIHHEKIAKVVYNISDKGIQLLESNCSQLETSPFNNTEKVDRFMSSIRLSIVQRKFILNNVQLAGAEAKEIKNTKSGIYTDVISILGIFSALIFALFGGVSMVSTIAGLVNKVRISKLVFLVSLISLLLIVLIFLLLNGISGMVGKNMKTCCNEKKCSHTLYQKYPFFVIGIEICGIILFASSIIMFLDSNHVIYNHYIWSSIVTLLFAIIFIGISYKLLFKH